MKTRLGGAGVSLCAFSVCGAPQGAAGVAYVVAVALGEAPNVPPHYVTSNSFA